MPTRNSDVSPLPAAWWKPMTILIALLVSGVLGVVDFMTGREVAISPFYLLPICWVAWRWGRASGLFVAVASAWIWLVADIMDKHEYPNRAIPYWNGLMLLIYFAVVVYLLTAFHDIHQRLEEKVEARTAALRREIAERQRLEAAKIRSERLAMVGTMAAEVAHEIRNPLGSIALNLDLVEREIVTLARTSRHAQAEGSELVGAMRVEVQRIRKVLEDYLQFARVTKSQRQPLALNEVLGHKLAFLGGEMAGARVNLHLDLDPGLATVHADAEQLWQVVLNLIRNGMEAMPEGGDLVVRTRRDGAHAVLQVSDSGQGMSDVELKRVFEPFFSTKPNGTGLGLALVQQIVNEHAGRVECASEPGRGSTFTLFLPLSEPR